MMINRIDINPNLVIPEACRGSCMVQKTLKSSKTYVNMRSIGPKNSDKMGTNKDEGRKSNVQGHFHKVEHHSVIDEETPYEDSIKAHLDGVYMQVMNHRMDSLRKGMIGPLKGEYVHCFEAEHNTILQGMV